MRNLLALIVFIILQILFIPLAIIGAIWIGYKQIVVSRKLGVSQTAIEIINGRWTMHIFGLRDDDAAAKLAPVLPNTSTFGLWLALFPLYVYSRIAGSTRWYPVIAELGEEGLANLVMNRSGYFDTIIDEAKGEAEQFVVMGAGLDTRAYNHLKNSGLKIFELDQAKTQQLKRTYLQKAGVDAAHVTFVETDFSQEDWFNTLTEAGYDATRRTIFLWEGVTLYLGETAVRNTLRTVKANSAKGSIIVADIYAKRFVSGEYDSRMKATLPILDVTDERFGFGLDMAGDDYQQSLESFVASEELTVGESYFMGYKTEKGTWMVVAELKV
ncbi:MAG: SAM-dependent methyltransferase [Chloroflexota bacterium]